LGTPDPGAFSYRDQTLQILSPLKPKDLPFLGAEQLRRQIDFIVKDLATTY
jgi:hypothetical protein